MDSANRVPGLKISDDNVLEYFQTKREYFGGTNEGADLVYCTYRKGAVTMKYPYMTLPDETEIARFDKLLHNNAHLIIELARAGGFENATAV